MNNITNNKFSVYGNYKKSNKGPNFKAKLAIKGISLEGLDRYIQESEGYLSRQNIPRITEEGLCGFYRAMEYLKNLPDDIVLMFDGIYNKCLNNGLEKYPNGTYMITNNSFFNRIYSFLIKDFGFIGRVSDKEAYEFAQGAHGGKTYAEIFNEFKNDIMLDGTKEPEKLLNEAKKTAKRPHKGEIDFHKIKRERTMPVGYRYADGKVQAPVGTDMSTLNVPPGTRLYYGPGDSRNGTTVKPNWPDD